MKERFFRKKPLPRVRRGSISRSIPLKVPRKLPVEAGDYQEIYDLFLKHGLRKGKIIGPLVEIGPCTGEFLNFLRTDPFFARNLNFSVCGIEPMSVPMPIKAMMKTVPGKVEDLAKQYPHAKGRFNFVIAKHVLDFESEGVNPKKIFKAISFITRKGGKVFLQTKSPEQMPSREEIKKEGFRVIDSKAWRFKSEFGSFKAGEYMYFILALQKVR